MTDLVIDEGVSHPQDTDHDSHVETEEDEKNIQLSTARKNSDVENKYLKKPHGQGNIKEIIKQTVNIEALNEPSVSFSGSSIDKPEVKMQQKNEASCLLEQFKMMQQQLEAIEEMSENVEKGFQNTKQFLKTVEHLSGAYYVDEEIANGFHQVDDEPTGTYSHSEVITEIPR
ncbi:uncharacterized protein LOC143233618 [Tachypleus tridentatus]|uniref:uncharacterized protein LOC143233618 n=1 Tax=Tachypleus tridentatus TaxID=6853 RepID=UPI003FD125F9